MAVPAGAHPGGPGLGPDCEKLKFTPDQEKSIHADHLELSDRMIDLDAASEHARLNYDKVITDEKSDAKAIAAAGQLVADALAKKISAEQELRSKIIAKLKPAQRADALRCGLLGEMHGEGEFHHGGFDPHHHHPGMMMPCEHGDHGGPGHKGPEAP